MKYGKQIICGLLAGLCLLLAGCGQKAPEQNTMTGTLDEKKDSQFVVTDDKNDSYLFPIDQKNPPEGLARVRWRPGDRDLYRRTVGGGCIPGNVISVEPAK